MTTTVRPVDDTDEDKRYEDQQEDVDEFVDYDITATPNDFNLSTLVSFIDAGVLVIPGFQRNYVWDLKRASKLIESLIRGLPVPQLFLYEARRNQYLVIDGQQRMMSIYYYFKQRFPRPAARPRLRSIFQKEGRIPDDVLNDDEYFSDFKLALPVNEPGKFNRLNGINYASLGDYQVEFNLRPLRNVVIRQNAPDDDDSAMYEIFSRLNSGGVNLRPQELRLSLYHSPFYEMLERINTEPDWRRFLHNPEPDIHMKDIEVLLRMFAMLLDANKYAPSLVKFLNRFSKDSQDNLPELNEYLEELFTSFLMAIRHFDRDTFINKGNNRFNIALMEAVFYAGCRDGYSKGDFVSSPIDEELVNQLGSNPEFVAAASTNSTSTRNVKLRLSLGTSILGSA